MSGATAGRHGRWPTRRWSTGVAIDLGSARTRLWISGRGLIADVPTISSSPTGAKHLVHRGSIVDALDTGPVLTGGGSLRPAIVYQLSKRLMSPVRPAPMPHTAAIRGAAQFVLAAIRHPSAQR